MSIYTSYDERKKLPASVFTKQTDVINADDSKNQERISSMDWR